jgi:hypothetical protein
MMLQQCSDGRHPRACKKKMTAVGTQFNAMDRSDHAMRNARCGVSEIHSPKKNVHNFPQIIFYMEKIIFNIVQGNSFPGTY